MHKMETPSLNNREIGRLIRFMHRGNPMYPVAEALSARDYARLPSANLYLGALEGSPDRRIRDRLLSAEALKYSNLSRIQQYRVEEALIAAIENRYCPPLVRGFTRLVNLVARMGALFLLIISLVTIDAAIAELPLLYFGLLLSYTIELLIALGIITLLFLVPVWSFHFDRRAELRLRQVCAETLGRWGGPASIHVLVSAVGIPFLWEAAGPSLRRVLQRLEPGDYGHLDSKSVEKLAVLFQPRFNWEMAGAWTPIVLDAYEKVGTGGCVGEVENLAVNAPTLAWREHAARILPILIERGKYERDSSQLLRSSRPEGQYNTLLRSAVLSPPSSPSSLLFPAQEPTEE